MFFEGVNMKIIKTVQNDPAKKGQLAGEKRIFGERNRYAVAPVHSRFESVGWFVWDAETIDPYTERDPVMEYPPAVIRIANSFEEAIAGLK